MGNGSVPKPSGIAANTKRKVRHIQTLARRPRGTYAFRRDNVAVEIIVKYGNCLDCSRAGKVERAGTYRASRCRRRTIQRVVDYRADSFASHRNSGAFSVVPCSHLDCRSGHLLLLPCSGEQHVIVAKRVGRTRSKDIVVDSPTREAVLWPCQRALIWKRDSQTLANGHCGGHATIRRTAIFKRHAHLTEILHLVKPRAIFATIVAVVLAVRPAQGMRPITFNVVCDIRPIHLAANRGDVNAIDGKHGLVVCNSAILFARRLPPERNNAGVGDNGFNPRFLIVANRPAPHAAHPIMRSLEPFREPFRIASSCPFLV